MDIKYIQQIIAYSSTNITVQLAGLLEKMEFVFNALNFAIKITTFHFRKFVNLFVTAVKATVNCRVPTVISNLIHRQVINNKSQFYFYTAENAP